MSSVSEMGSFTSFEDARDWSALPPTAAVMVLRREGSKRAITGHRPPFIRITSAAPCGVLAERITIDPRATSLRAPHPI